MTQSTGCCLFVVLFQNFATEANSDVTVSYCHGEDG